MVPLTENQIRVVDLLYATFVLINWSICVRLGLYTCLYAFLVHPVTDMVELNTIEGCYFLLMN